MEEIKVRHGTRNGVLILILGVSTVTCRGHIALAKWAGNFSTPVDDQNPIWKLWQFNCVWSLNLRDSCKSLRNGSEFLGFSTKRTLLPQLLKKRHLKTIPPPPPSEPRTKTLFHTRSLNCNYTSVTLLQPWDLLEHVRIPSISKSRNVPLSWQWKHKTDTRTTQSAVIMPWLLGVSSKAADNVESTIDVSQIKESNFRSRVLLKNKMICSFSNSNIVASCPVYSA